MGEGGDEVLNAVADRIVMTSDPEIVELSRVTAAVVESSLLLWDNCLFFFFRSFT